MDKPLNIAQYEQEIKAIVTEYGKTIPIERAAEVMGIDKASLRKWLYTGTCPFGIGIEGEGAKYGYTRILSLPWYYWMMKQAI